MYSDPVIFLWDEPLLRYQSTINCDMAVVYEDPSYPVSYAFGLRKKSPFTNNISMAILHFMESGYIRELETR